MSTGTVSKESALAVAHFEGKLAFETNPYGLKQALDNKEPLQIIDLRTPELFAKGHIPGATNVDFAQLEKYLPKLDKNRTTVVYCYDLLCSLATKAALLLAKHDYKVKELVGGWQSWAEKEMPKEAGSASACSVGGHSSCG